MIIDAIVGQRAGEVTVDLEVITIPGAPDYIRPRDSRRSVIGGGVIAQLAGEVALD